MERKELLLTLMIGVLLLTTAMQTISLAGLSNGQVSAPARTVTNSPAPSSSAPPTSGSSAGSLANLPSMVGGC